MENKKQNKLIVYSIAIIVVIIDQIIKILISQNFSLYESVQIIPNFFKLYYLKNTGAAFSFLSDNIPFLVVVSLLCIALIINVISKENYKNKLNYFSLGILMGGMIGNLIDRLFYGGVIDFLSFTILSYRFPVFNIADIAITVGIAIYVIISLLEAKNEI